MSRNAYTTRIGVFIGYTLMRGILRDHAQHTCSQEMEEEEEERWEMKKAAVKRDQRRDGTEVQTRAGE